eukprot:Transcript_22961.p1 GENE.Transcript_22961~~Transcript_22961.p1  ORF type:complete len:226 (-),score=20.99 Transcript_22961:205-882(-)
MVSPIALALVLQPMAWRLPVGGQSSPRRSARPCHPHMDESEWDRTRPSGDTSSWRPKTVDPLGKAFGAAGFGARDVERSHELWLDLRTAETTFAQMVVMKLFYSVRRVIDEAGKALPNGAAVQGLLFDETRYDRADTIGQNLPIFVETSTGIVNATLSGAPWDPMPVEIRSPSTVDELTAAQEELEGGSHVTSAVAISADPLLWSVALTGLLPSELECLAGNEGA